MDPHMMDVDDKDNIVIVVALPYMYLFEGH